MKILVYYHLMDGLSVGQIKGLNTILMVKLSFKNASKKVPNIGNSSLGVMSYALL